MEKLENCLYQAVVSNDQDSVSHLLKQGANPNKVTSQGKTCLGEAAHLGNISILKLLIDSSSTQSQNKQIAKRSSKLKTQKRKLRNEVVETLVKFKNPSDRSINECSKDEKNQGYFVFIHSDASSSEESRVPPIQSPLLATPLTPSPQGDLEWDEEIGNVAATTSEDETWSSLYKWYASILESTGAALASAASVSYDINQQDAFSKTALHYAAEHGKTCAVKLLIDAGCKVDLAAIDGMSPLHVASIRNNCEIAKLLLAAGSNVNYKTHDKMTPLHFAASRGLLDMVKILINNGANLEVTDTNERTALYLASGRGHVDVVEHLITAGANVNVEEIRGYTPLCEAVWQRSAAVVALLLSRGARLTYSHKLLHNAIIQHQEAMVELLSGGGGMNLHDDNGDTPLLLATRLSQVNVVRMLLRKGASVNSCNGITGSSALHIAVESVDDPVHFEDLLRCFIQYRIDMDLISLIGDTALNRALLLQRDEAAALLIRYGANVNICDLHSCGLDNLVIASRRRAPGLARLLVRAGHSMPPPAAQTRKSTGSLTWLHEACRNPLSLTDLTRITIRRMSKHKVLFAYIDSLPLPKSLKRYLMLEDESL